jgi:hypothetical protein
LQATCGAINPKENNMTECIISATFEDEEAAGRAVADLRRAGVADDAIAVLRRSSSDRDGNMNISEGKHADNKGTGTLKGLGVGAGVGAVFGLAALVIPGVGPFIAAGSLIESLGVLGSAAASGAIVGGTAGGVAGALMRYGVDEADARDYERDIQAGRIWVGVSADRTAVDRESIRTTLHQADRRDLSARDSAMVG